MTTWTTTTHWPPDLLRVADLTGIGLGELLDLAPRMRADPGGWTDALAGESLACLFEVPTTRAGLSVEAAAHRLGMLPITVRPDELRQGRGESLDDTARILSGYAQAVVVRDVADLTLAKMARAASVPVINALSPEHHPCQAVADLLTLRDRFGDLEGLVLAYVGVAGGVSRSLMQAGAMAGMAVRLACPPDSRPDPTDVTAAELLADLHGGAVSVTDDPREAVAGADAIYTAEWPTTPDATEHRRLVDRLRPYRVETTLLARAKPTVVFMHSLPAHRGEEVAGAVIDGRHSVVWEQAANRLPAEQAIIYALVSAARAERGVA